jgi:AcrR family transcriptional regulator
MRSMVREDVRESIITATDRLIERYGYKKMTVDDVAREAGVGKGTIYLYFPSKEELALCCADRMYATIIEELRLVAQSIEGPAERVRRMLVARVLLRFDAVQRFAASLDEVLAALRPSLLARRQKWFAGEAEIFADALREGQRQGLFTGGDPLQIAHTLLLATNALMPFSLSPKELGERDDVERRAGQVADLVLHGILARAEGGAPTAV